MSIVTITAFKKTSGYVIHEFKQLLSEDKCTMIRTRADCVKIGLSEDHWEFKHLFIKKGVGAVSLKIQNLTILC